MLGAKKRKDNHIWKAYKMQAWFNQKDNQNQQNRPSILLNLQLYWAVMKKSNIDHVMKK